MPDGTGTFDQQKQLPEFITTGIVQAISGATATRRACALAHHSLMVNVDIPSPIGLGQYFAQVLVTCHQTTHSEA